MQSFFNPANWLRQTGLLVYLHTDGINVIDALTGVEATIASKNDITAHMPTSFKSPSYKPESANDFNWQGAIETLTIKLALIKPKPKTSMRVVLSSDFVRYLLLPAQVVTLSNGEKNAYARAAFRQLHGSIADKWQIKCDNTAPHQAAMLAAIDLQLTQSLVQITDENQLKLLSLTPYLMQVFNGIRKHLKLFNGYLVLVEGGRIILLNIKDGQIDQLKSQFIADDWHMELNQTLDREQTLGHASSNNVIIYAPHHETKLPFIKKGWSIDYVEQSPQGFMFSSNLNLSHLSAST